MGTVQPSPRNIKHESARYRLRIGRSRIHNLGVFALEDIPKGQQVIEYTGRRLTLDQALRLNLRPSDEDHLIVISRKSVMNGSVGGSGAEFINHSCSPNLMWQRRHGRLFFYSTRLIRAGEELTLYFSHPTKARRIPCLCGARRCKKTFRYDVGHEIAARVRLRMKTNERMVLPQVNSKIARYRLRVGRSGIHQLGLYALEDIPANRRVIEYTGRRITWAQAARIPPPKNLYVARIKMGISAVDGAVGGSGAEFTNHSCNPNVAPRIIRDRLFFISLRKIQAGEELALFYDYPNKLQRVPCRCGAYNCRGTYRLLLTFTSRGRPPA